MAILLGAMWVIEVIDFVATSGGLDQLGIRPRSKSGLWGIFRAPFLHAGWQHLSANSVPFVVLGLLVLLRGLRDFLGSTLIIIVLGGSGVWLFGQSNSVHVGASGLIFGYFGFLVVIGILERSLVGVLTSVSVVFLYGGIIWGVLPTTSYISWEGHLFGLLAGAMAAKWLVKEKNASD
jgi:membrane associated rhomboid family serine protease